MNTGPGTRPFLITYTQLATIVLYDQGLTRSPNDEQHSAVCLKVWAGRPAPPQKQRTMEERRVILALWFTSSMYVNPVLSLIATILTISDALPS